MGSNKVHEVASRFNLLTSQSTAAQTAQQPACPTCSRRKTWRTRPVDWPSSPRRSPARLTSTHGKPAVRSSVSCGLCGENGSAGWGVRGVRLGAMHKPRQPCEQAASHAGVGPMAVQQHGCRTWAPHDPATKAPIHPPARPGAHLGQALQARHVLVDAHSRERLAQHLAGARVRLAQQQELVPRLWCQRWVAEGRASQLKRHAAARSWHVHGRTGSGAAGWSARCAAGVAAAPAAGPRPNLQPCPIPRQGREGAAREDGQTPSGALVAAARWAGRVPASRTPAHLVQADVQAARPREERGDLHGASSGPPGPADRHLQDPEAVARSASSPRSAGGA